MRSTFAGVWSSLLIVALLLFPFATSASSHTTIIPAAGIGIGIGLTLGQMLNNSANNACKGCQDVDPSKPRYCKNIECSVVTNGYTVTGRCGAPSECRASSYQGLGGGTQTLGLALQVAGLIGTLAMMSQNASGGSAPTPAQTVPAAYGGCVNYYSVTKPSSDPCAIYNPNPVSETIASAPITDFEEIPTQGGSIAEQLAGLLNDEGTTVDESKNAELARLAGFEPENMASSSESSKGGAASPIVTDIREGKYGTTFIANIRDSLSEVAGFFGSKVTGTGNQSFMGRMCSSRPWNFGIIGKYIGPLLDMLCTKLGLQVGEVKREEIAPQKSFTIESVRPLPERMARPQVAPAEVDIWADPPVVRLGTRTKIFWRSTNVDSCVVAGPSFEQSSLQGGGTTVPITDTTVFTIRCLLPDGTSITDSASVNLSI